MSPQAPSKHSYETPRDTEYFDHIKMWLLEVSRCKTLQTIMFHRPMCAWVQNSVVTTSTKFITLLLSCCWLRFTCFSLKPENCSFMFMDVISLCTDISCGSSDSEGAGLQLEQMKDRSPRSSWLRRASENISGKLLECVLNSVAPRGIRTKQQELIDFLLVR